jgi:hypothetical protein
VCACVLSLSHLAPGIDFKPQFSSTDDLRSPEAMFGTHHAEFERITARVTVELQGVDLNTSGGPSGEEAGEGELGTGSRLAVSSLAPADVELLCDVHASAFAPATAMAPVRDLAVKDVVTRSELCARCGLDCMLHCVLSRFVEGFLLVEEVVVVVGCVCECACGCVGGGAGRDFKQTSLLPRPARRDLLCLLLRVGDR